MITGIRGKVTRREANALEVEVGPVRLWVFVPAYLAERSAAGRTIALETALLNEEMGPCLCGFGETRERDFFLRLLSINSVGRRAAMKVLDAGLGEALARIKHAWLNDETSLPGLGPKTSRNIIAELGEEVAKNRWGAVKTKAATLQEEALAALKALGATDREARSALRKVLKRFSRGKVSPEHLVREALKHLK